MTSFSIRSFSLVMLTLTGCSCSEVTPSPDASRAPDAFAASDASPALDVPAAADAFSADAFVAADAREAIDVGTDAAADARAVGTDAPSSCPRVIPDRLAGVCDGRGRMICAMWATESSGGAPASAVCLGPEGLCARASACTGATLDTCTCGRGPACGQSEVCISGFAGYSCVCAP